LYHCADRLGPTDGPLDPFAVLDGQGMAVVPGRPSVVRQANACICRERAWVRSP
jgi:hypothetical protein